MSKRMKWMTIALVTLIVIFLVSFFLTDIIINKDNEATSSNVVIGETSKATPLKDNIKIQLFKGEIKEKEDTLENIKKELNLTGEVTIENLEKVLKNKGYTLESGTNSIITFVRTAESTIIPNRYYIKSQGEYLAIFKSNEKGELFIEDSNKDVYKNCRKYSELPEGDKKVIDNLELNFETKDEAIEEITSFIS